MDLSELKGLKQPKPLVLKEPERADYDDRKAVDIIVCGEVIRPEDYLIDEDEAMMELAVELMDQMHTLIVKLEGVKMVAPLRNDLTNLKKRIVNFLLEGS